VPQLSFGGGGGGVSFGGGGGGVNGGVGGGDIDLPAMLERLKALERAAAADVGGQRASSPVGSVAVSQASTLSHAVTVASLLDAIGLPDEEFSFSRQLYLSRVWSKNRHGCQDGEMVREGRRPAT
jgi:hypothetical protein